MFVLRILNASRSQPSFSRSISVSDFSFSAANVVKMKDETAKIPTSMIDNNFFIVYPPISSSVSMCCTIQIYIIVFRTVIIVLWRYPSGDFLSRSLPWAVVKKQGCRKPCLFHFQPECQSTRSTCRRSQGGIASQRRDRSCQPGESQLTTRPEARMTRTAMPATSRVVHCSVMR